MLGWQPFYHGRVVAMVGPPFRGDSVVRPYGFGGSVIFGLPKELSRDTLAFGGIGGIGLEFGFHAPHRAGPVTYFVELGGIGTSAKASSLTTKESIASGFFISAGVRGYP
jgi:hypothetical protein